MAQQIFYNGYLMLGTTDVSASCKSITVNHESEMKDDTVMGDTGLSRAKGLENWSLDVELIDDFVDEAMDEDIYTLYAAGTCAVAFKPINAAASTSNPRYSGTGIISGFPIGGNVGDLAVKRLKILSKGTVLARATADP